MEIYVPNNFNVTYDPGAYPLAQSVNDLVDTSVLISPSGIKRVNSCTQSHSAPIAATKLLGKRLAVDHSIRLRQRHSIVVFCT
jgi:hypothetical protein